MEYIQPENRQQIEMISMEMLIASDNEVRVIDAFVEVLGMKQLGISAPLATEGRPPFHPKTFLKLYLYGYMNRIRSSRRLEKECQRNIELKWLLGNLTPNYHSIADFRKENGRQFKTVFKLFVLFLKEEELLGKTTIAIDGSKFRAVNSKKNNYNEKKIKRHLEYIENKAAEYLTQLDSIDAEENNTKEKFIQKKDIKKKIRQLKERKIFYEEVKKKVQTSDDGQVSATDAQSRALIINKNIVEVSYNTQTAVDDKNNLIVHYEATNKNDSKALHKTAVQAKEILEAKKLTALADKGYHNGEQIEKCEQENITTLVANREQPSVKHLDEKFLVENFQYNKASDSYTCPAGHNMKSNGNWYLKSHKSKERKNPTAYKVKHYKTKQCQNCPLLNQCTKNTRGRGRVIERSQHQDAVDRNNERIRTQHELYRKRQQICEHPFGTIKRQWGYTYTLLKGLNKVDGEMGIIFTCYNLRRVISIMGVKKLLKKLKKWKPNYKKVKKWNQPSFRLPQMALIEDLKSKKIFSYQMAA